MLTNVRHSVSLALVVAASLAAGGCASSSSAPPAPPDGCGEDFISLEYRFGDGPWEAACIPLKPTLDGRFGVSVSAMPLLPVGTCALITGRGMAVDRERGIVVNVSGIGASPSKDWWRRTVTGPFTVMLEAFGPACAPDRACITRTFTCEGSTTRVASAPGDIVEARLPGPCELGLEDASEALRPTVRNVVLRGHLLSPAPEDGGVACTLEF